MKDTQHEDIEVKGNDGIHSDAQSKIFLDPEDTLKKYITFILKML